MSQIETILRYVLAGIAMIVCAVLTGLGHIPGNTTVGVIFGILGTLGIMAVPAPNASARARDTIRKSGPLALAGAGMLFAALCFNGCDRLTWTPQSAAQVARATEASLCGLTYVSCNFYDDAAKQDQCLRRAQIACQMLYYVQQGADGWINALSPGSGSTASPGSLPPASSAAPPEHR